MQTRVIHHPPCLQRTMRQKSASSQVSKRTDLFPYSVSIRMPSNVTVMRLFVTCTRTSRCLAHFVPSLTRQSRDDVSSRPLCSSHAHPRAFMPLFFVPETIQSAVLLQKWMHLPPSPRFTYTGFPQLSSPVGSQVPLTAAELMPVAPWISRERVK